MFGVNTERVLKYYLWSFKYIIYNNSDNLDCDNIPYKGLFLPAANFYFSFLQLFYNVMNCVIHKNCPHINWRHVNSFTCCIMLLCNTIHASLEWDVLSVIYMWSQYTWFVWIFCQIVALFNSGFIQTLKIKI